MTASLPRRLLLFGDGLGIPQLMNAIPMEFICGLVGAENRPHCHQELEALGGQHGLPVLFQPSAKSDRYSEFVEKATALCPDLILVNSYSLLLREGILAIPKFGAINIHGALLPQYRGANPIQWALLNNETETGVTMHYMTPQFDTGDIISQKRVNIEFQDTWKAIQQKLMAATDALLAEEMPRVLNLTNSRQPQNDAEARYYTRRHPEDGRIEWSQHSVLYIYNLVRALVSPHPGAFYLDGSGKIVLDQYLSLYSVVVLKYSYAGKQMLESGGLTLSPLCETDVPHVANWIIEGHLSLSDTSDQLIGKGRYAEWLEAVQHRNDLIIFCPRLPSEHAPIGICAVDKVNYPRCSAELQVLLECDRIVDTGCVKKGFSLLLHFAFKDLELRHVCLKWPKVDEKFIALLEGIGFVREDELPSSEGSIASDGIVAMGMSYDHYAGR